MEECFVMPFCDFLFFYSLFLTDSSRFGREVRILFISLSFHFVVVTVVRT